MWQWSGVLMVQLCDTCPGFDYIHFWVEVKWAQVHLDAFLHVGKYICFTLPRIAISRDGYSIQAFISTRPLVHKHVKISVGKWIMETTRPHKHVQIPEDQFFFGLTLFAMIISQLDKYPKMFNI